MGDSFNELDIYLPVGDADGAFARSVARLRKLLGEALHSLGAGIEAYVPLGCGKMDDVVAFPVGGHAPGNALLRLGQGFLGSGDMAVFLHYSRRVSDVPPRIGR